VDEKNNSGDTPLCLAAFRGHELVLCPPRVPFPRATDDIARAVPLRRLASHPHPFAFLATLAVSCELKCLHLPKALCKRPGMCIKD
jgi:hypothetical protein